MATTCLKKDPQSGHFHKGANGNGKRWGGGKERLGCDSFSVKKN